MFVGTMLVKCNTSQKATQPQEFTLWAGDMPDSNPDNAAVGCTTTKPNTPLQVSDSPPAEEEEDGEEYGDA